MKKKDNVKSESNIVEIEYGGSVDYSEQFFQAVKNKKNLSHEDIINIQKSSVGKVKDFGLRNPSGIHIIERYELPTDEELIQQLLDGIICETCFMSEYCNGTYCIMK